MRPIPPALLAELSSGTFAVCRLVTITRRNAAAIRFAEHQADVTVEGNTYTAARGIRMSTLPMSLNAAETSIDFEIALVEGGLIEPDDLRLGLYDNASVVIWLASYANPANGIMRLWRGFMGDIDLTDQGLVRVTARGLFSKAKEIPIEHYSPTDRAFLGDTRNKINLAPLTKAGTVTAVSGYTVTLSGAAAGEAANHFNLGLIIPTSGDSVGEAFEIRSSTGGTFRMYLSMRGKLSVGDAVNVIPGYDARLETARDRWDNVVNFRGEKHIPGADALQVNFTDWGT